LAANDARFLQVLREVEAGRVSSGQALEQLRYLPYEDLGYAKLDHHRGLRQGLPEVVFGLGKSPHQLRGILERLVPAADKLLVTRTTQAAWDFVRDVVPDAAYYADAQAIVYERDPHPVRLKGVTVVTAGTADIPVAEEACLTAELMGHQVERIYDVGVAGIHRLLDVAPRLRAANVLMVAAGMEGALPSVVAGLVDRPVIAVPTSIGYGASFGGLAPLLAMLNSCATGVAVVNIDNGFGAGYMAACINELAWKGRPDEQ
jgi:hypothetical protein